MASNIQSLTALRGLAAFAVLAFHCAAPVFGGAARVPLPLGRGYLAVDLFFLLSGFVLMHVHEREFGGGVTATKLKSFLLARFARTYPVHAAVLLMLLPLYGSRPEFSGTALLPNLLLMQIWRGDMTWNFGAWSVGAEWHAYLLFPLLVMPLRLRAALGIAMVLILCLATLAIAIVASGNSGNIAMSPSVLLRCLPEFVAGMAIHRIYRENWLRRFFAGDGAAVAVAIAALALASIPGTDLAVVVMLALLLLAAAHNRGWVARVLATRAPLFLGRISYSLYMVQMVAAVLAYAAARHWPAIAGTGIGEAALIFGLSFALAVPLSRFVEYPLRDWLRGARAARPASIHMLAAVDR
jgi:peptidoglycan/LPS O-acetylase OafA/YrhL